MTRLFAHEIILNTIRGRWRRFIWKLHGVLFAIVFLAVSLYTMSDRGWQGTGLHHLLVFWLIVFLAHCVYMGITEINDRTLQTGVKPKRHEAGLEQLAQMPEERLVLARLILEEDSNLLNEADVIEKVKRNDRPLYR